MFEQPQCASLVKKKLVTVHAKIKQKSHKPHKSQVYPHPLLFVEH